MNELVYAHTNSTDFDHIDKLIEAVFLSNVKILSTVRIGKTKTVNISVPNTKNFIHKCYIETARKLWQDPYLIDNREHLSHIEIKKNIKRFNNLISDSIEQSVRELIPLQTILENYLNDIDLEEPELESEQEPEPEPEPEPEQEREENQEQEENQEDNNRNSDFFMNDPNDGPNDDHNYLKPDLEVSNGDNIHDSLHQDENRELLTKNVKLNQHQPQHEIPTYTHTNTNTHEDLNTNTNQNEDNSPFFSDSDHEN